MPTALSISSSVSLSGSPFCLPLSCASVAPGVLSHRAQSSARNWIILDLEVLAALQQDNKYLLLLVFFSPLDLDNETAHKVAHVSLLFRHPSSPYAGKTTTFAQPGRTCVLLIYKETQVCWDHILWKAEQVAEGAQGFLNKEPIRRQCTQWDKEQRRCNSAGGAGAVWWLRVCWRVRRSGRCRPALACV